MSSITNPALFMWHHHNDKLIGVMTVHVDDFLCAGTDLFYLSIISKLRETLSAGRGNCDFQYLGSHIQSEKFHIAIDQNNNIEQLKKVDTDPVCKSPKN